MRGKPLSKRFLSVTDPIQQYLHIHHLFCKLQCLFSTIEFESTIRSNLKNSKVYTYPETKFPCLCHTLCGNFMPMEPEARAGVTTFSTSSLGYSQFSTAHGRCYKNTETRFKSTGWQRQNTTWIIGCSNPVGFWSYFIWGLWRSQPFMIGCLRLSGLSWPWLQGQTRVCLWPSCLSCCLCSLVIRRPASVSDWTVLACLLFVGCACFVVLLLRVFASSKSKLRPPLPLWSKVSSC